MRKALLLTLSVAVTTAFAQDRVYLPGYVVTTAGETIRGSLMNDFTDVTISTVTFQNEAGRVSSYGPGELQSFYFESTKQLFVSKEVFMDRKPIEYENLDQDDPEPKTRYVHIFMMVLAKGPATLYYHKDFRQHFFLEKNDSIAELYQLKYRSLAKSSVETVNLYKDQLKDLLGDCAKLKNFDVAFALEALASLVVQYNTCKGGKKASTFEYDTKADSARFVPFIMGGFSLSYLKYKGSDLGRSSLGSVHAKFSPSFSPVIGVGIESNPRRTIGGASFALNLFYRQVNFTSSYSDIGFKHEINLGYSYIRTNVLLRLSPKEVKLTQPVIMFGVSLGGSFAEKNNLKEYQHNRNDELVYNDIVREFQKIDYGIVAGVGVKRRHIGADLRLEQNLKYHDSSIKHANRSSAQLSTTTVMLLVSYTFADFAQ